MPYTVILPSNSTPKTKEYESKRAMSAMLSLDHRCYLADYIAGQHRLEEYSGVFEE